VAPETGVSLRQTVAEPVRRPLDPWDLGATLYVPATRPDVADMLAGQGRCRPRALILCVEDSVAPRDKAGALDRLRQLLPARQTDAAVFLRPADQAMAEAVIASPLAEAVDGLVLPKSTPQQVSAIAWACQDFGRALWLMPTLEHASMLTADGRAALLSVLIDPVVAPQILTLRVGAHDLLSSMALRRRAGASLYDGPMGRIVVDLVGCFRPAGFALSAPVFDGLEEPGRLAADVRWELAHGLIGKSAIHPDQLLVIEAEYAVSDEDLALAQAILAETAPAVFQSGGQMIEPAVHRPWARQILVRAERFGVRSEDIVSGA